MPLKHLQKKLDGVAEHHRESEAAAFGPCSLHPEERPQTGIGFTESIYCEKSDLWADAFFTALGNGMTIDQARLQANIYVSTKWPVEQTTLSFYCAGDQNQKITD